MRSFLVVFTISIILAVPVESSFAGPMMGPIGVNQSPSNNPPHMVVLGNKIYMVWTVSIPTGGKQMFFKKSIDGGKTFENQILLDNDTYAQEPSLSVNGNNVYVAWSSQFNEASKLVIQHSSDGGTSFQKVSPNVGKIRGINLIAVESSENLSQLIWTGTIGPNRTQVVVLSQSTNGGSSFDGPTYINDPKTPSFLPQVAHADSNTYVMWNSQENSPCVPMYQICNVTHYFRPIIDGKLGDIVHLGSLDGQIPIDIAADKNTVFVEGLKRTYQDNFFKNSTILISESTDGGRSFSDISLNTDMSMDNIHLVIAGNSVYQFWTVYDNGFAPEPIFAEKSTDGGKTFGLPINVSGKTTPLAVDLSSQVISFGDKINMVWMGTDEAGANHIFFESLGPDSSGNVRIIENLQGGGFQIGTDDSTVYLSYISDGNLIFEKIDNSGYSTTDFSCSTNPNPVTGSITMDTPQILIDGNPTQNILVGWKSQVKSSLQNTENRDLNVVYQVQTLRNGVVWKSQENLTLLCGKSSDATVYWSPQNAGNYTINTVIVNPNSNQIISSNNATVQVSENSDLKTFSTYDSPVVFKILNKTSQVNQEGFAKFLVQAGPSSPNYKLSTINLSIDSPQGVQGWFDQYSIYSFDNKPQNLTLYVYADSAATSNLNTLKIEGKGAVENLVTGEYFNVGNPMGLPEGMSQYPQNMLDEQKGYQQVGTVNLDVIPITPMPTTYVKVGSPDIHPVHFCTKPSGPFEGTSCSGFIGYEEIPLEVYANKAQKVILAAKNFPDGAWFKFQPQELVATPQGTPSKLIIASALKPFMINVLATQVTRIYANSSDSSSIAYLPLTQGGNSLKILNSTGPIEFGSLTTNINNTTPNSVGIVYDSNQSTSLPVSLSVLGMAKDDKIVPIPSWLSISFYPPSFTLNSSQPYYFEIETSTLSPPPGANATVVIGEKIGEKNFVGHIQINIPQPMMMGSMPITASPAMENTPHLAPLEQFKSGTSLKDIKCKQGLELVEKKEDNTPACVKPDTKTILVDNGWAILIQ